METLKNKRIIVGITGGIAAYKSAELVRRLKEQGADVRVVMTAAAQEFITPMTLQALSGYPVHGDLWDPQAEAAMGHIELARWADLIVVAPASADFIARLSHGHANDLLSTICLATNVPIAVAPAMNQQMWLKPITQENIQRLEKYNIHLLGPAAGSQACGEFGPGRLLEPGELLKNITDLLASKIFNGETILITAGPTREAIDPVRYITNHSSGKMGYAIAIAAQRSGAKVILISGPTHLTPPANVEFISVDTAEQMYQAVHEKIKSAKIFIATAAVADFSYAKPASQKIKKNSKTELNINLTATQDILASVTKLTSHPFVVGFAAETENLISNAEKKLIEKKLNMIAANLVGKKNSGFDSDTNELTVLWNKGKKELSLTSKQHLAHQLLQLIAEHYYAKNSA